MWPVIGGLLGGLGSFFGAEQSNQQSAANTMMQSASNVALQNSAQNFNRDMMYAQEDYNTNMANTAFQRASADMKAAGLNPMIMAGGGGGAATPGISPSGSPGGQSASQPTFTSPLSSLGNTIQNVVSNAVAAKTMDKMTDEISNLQATKQKIIAETAATGAEEENIRARTGTQYQETGLKRAASEVMQNAAETARNQQEINPTLRRLLDMGAYVGDKGSATLSPILNILSGAKDVGRMFPSRSTSETTRSDGSSSFTERYNAAFH